MKDQRDTISKPPSLYSSEKNLQLVPIKEPPLALSEVSLWILSQTQAVSHFLGMSFGRIERQAIELFTALEQEISTSGSK